MAKDEYYFRQQDQEYNRRNYPSTAKEFAAAVERAVAFSKAQQVKHGSSGAPAHDGDVPCELCDAPTRRMVQARLKQKCFGNGIEAMGDHVPLGKSYLVDANSRRRGINTCSSGQSFEVEIIQVDNGTWLPTEVLEIEG